jgi:hypothetical protein
VKQGSPGAIWKRDGEGIVTPPCNRAFIAISFGLTPPACAIQSITFLSDTRCCVKVTSSTVTGISQILHHELLLTVRTACHRRTKGEHDKIPRCVSHPEYVNRPRQ